MQGYDLEPIVNRVFELIDLEVGGNSHEVQLKRSVIV